MSRCLLVFVAIVAVVSCAPKQDEDTGRILHHKLPFPLPFPLPPLPSLQDLLPRPTTFGKPGLCPFVRRLVPQTFTNTQSASVCGNLCLDDSACPLGQKCCPHECGYSCFNAIKIVH
ncbi:hypothetical protein B566_EDAN004482 [Ephemera danica]|nr:hypothetical protein B566_EDAN004482 [Ephemera danica]